MPSRSDILHAKILIVDDQRANVLLLEQMLRREGYVSLSSTMDGGEVCELHLVNRFDLILLDLQMPGMDGFQVMENLKELETGSYLPVVVVTAQPAHKLRALQAGARDFVSKPFDIPEVLLRVHNMLEVRLLHREARDLYARVQAEQNISGRLLHSVLPLSIAERLNEHRNGTWDGELVADGYAEVTALFADLVEFTKYAEGASAAVLGSLLDDISARFDSLADGTVLDREEAIDDGWLACAGLSDPVAVRTVRAAQKAMDLLEAICRFNAHSRYKLRVSIGLNTHSDVPGGIGGSQLHAL